MSSKGYIKLHRQVVEWGWYQDAVVARVFIHLLLTANYEDAQWRDIVVKRGQRVLSYQKLAAELELPKTSIYRAIRKLEETKEIQCEATATYTVVTILNYDRYQDNETDEAERPLHEKYSSVRRPAQPKPSTPANPQDVAVEFNKICTSLEPVGELTYHQAHAVAFAATFMDGKSFTELFNKVERSDCLTGRANAGFKATFDWILRPVNLEKILAGKYDENYEKGKSNGRVDTNKQTTKPEQFTASGGFRE